MDVLQGGVERLQQTSVQNQNIKNNNRGGFNMFKLMKKRIKNEKGLTLIELLAVIVILAIVSAIAVPAIGGIIENSRYNAVKADAINVINAANLYYTDTPNTSTAVTVQNLLDEDYLDTAGMIPTAATVSIASPRAITTTTAITYSGNKTITFTSATVDLISDDPQKGSSSGNKTIAPPTPTP